MEEWSESDVLMTHKAAGSGYLFRLEVIMPRMESANVTNRGTEILDSIAEHFSPFSWPRRKLN